MKFNPFFCSRVEQDLKSEIILVLVKRVAPRRSRIASRSMGTQKWNLSPEGKIGLERILRKKFESERSARNLVRLTVPPKT